jgi:DNA-binding transcriptional MocR family regulator
MPWTPRIAGETAPLYIAIADAIAADAETGQLAPGTRLPTHRALAATLGVDSDHRVARLRRGASTRARRRARGSMVPTYAARAPLPWRPRRRR